jgi:hypothetical protein
MAAEEDKKFDAVLGGFLVNDRRARAGNLHCPESDVLAAYHERSLPLEEMNSWKEHIVGCTRCQAVLAELEATDSIPLRAPEEASRKEPALLPKRAAVAREERKPAPAKFQKKSRITAISSGVRWQWLAPAGALAAGLLVWVAWHENQPLPWKTPTPVKTAKLEPSSKSAPEPPSPQQAAASPQLDQTQTDRLAGKDQAAAAGALSAEEKQTAESLKLLEKSPARVRNTPVKPSTNTERGAREDAAHDLMSARPTANQTAPEPRVGVAAAAAQVVQGQTETADAQVQAQPSPLSAPAPSPPTAAGAAPEKKAKAESRGATLHAAAAAPPSPTAYLMARAGDLNLIVTPNRKTFWRAGHAGMIEFSSDGGASWSGQSSNVVVDLTAGSAPSEKVCWIVGRAGTILLTTDAGARWAVLHSPLEEDLGGVRATDALHATIWNLGNTKVFETADGGGTWRPATSQ